MKTNYVDICGVACVKIKESDIGSIYITSDILFKSEFGKNNNYAESYVRM